MTQVVTVLEARVVLERAADLQAAYAEAGAGPFPLGFIRSTLLRLNGDATQWRVETVLYSRDALTAVRGAGKPRGVQIFEAADATPSLVIYDAIASLEPPTQAA